MKDIRKVLTIAGSDPSGGAGIQADIKTITAHKMYAMNISTALTVQNTTGIRDTFVIPPDFIAEQIDAIYDDIRPDAVKIGMVANDAIVRTRLPRNCGKRTRKTSCSIPSSPRRAAAI